jgi:hypothetical protein
VIIRHLIVPLTMAVLAVQVAEVRAQGAFPAPLPGAMAPPAAADPAFPPVNGAAPRAMVSAPGAFPSGGAPPMGGGFGAPPPQAGPPGGDECMNGFLPLRKDAEKRGAMIKAASEHHAPPDEACKLIGNFAQSEVKMIKYIDTHMQKCGIPAQVGEQMKNGHKNTEAMLSKVCSAAQQATRGPAGPSLSEVLGSSAALPEATAKKSGGSTFDTLSGNVLTR